MPPETPSRIFLFLRSSMENLSSRIDRMPELAKQEKIELLRLARRAIEALLRERRIEVLNPGSLGLHRAGGAFVSLHRQGQLRGCIGRIITPDPLYRTVQEMAAGAPRPG